MISRPRLAVEFYPSRVERGLRRPAKLWMRLGPVRSRWSVAITASYTGWAQRIGIDAGRCRVLEIDFYQSRPDG